MSSPPIEFLDGYSVRPQISHAIFDFDGTLSWLRHGWPEVMYRIFRSHLPPTSEKESDLRDWLLDDILGLNGKPTIYQMRRFCDRARARGGRPPRPEELLHDYQTRLDASIAERVAQIRSGAATVDDFVIYGGRPLLERLHARGVTLIILSGTIEHRVQEEAALLKLNHFFGRHVYGSGLPADAFSKDKIMARLLAEEKISGEQVLSFGDGPVEIRHTREMGGLAIGVASDEAVNGSGRPDPWKRKQLVQAGAQALIVDYREPDLLIEAIFGKS